MHFANSTSWEIIIGMVYIHYIYYLCTYTKTKYINNIILLSLTIYILYIYYHKQTCTAACLRLYTNIAETRQWWPSSFVFTYHPRKWDFFIITVAAVSSPRRSVEGVRSFAGSFFGVVIHCCSRWVTRTIHHRTRSSSKRQY